MAELWKINYDLKYAFFCVYYILHWKLVLLPIPLGRDVPKFTGKRYTLKSLGIIKGYTLNSLGRVAPKITGKGCTFKTQDFMCVIKAEVKQWPVDCVDLGGNVIN